MRIGLDFDNTLIKYDHVFAEEAKRVKLIPKQWKGTKKQLRDTLRSIKDGEHMWQKLQGKVYGPEISKAELFPGVAQFLIRCKQRREEIFIVSHKTEYAHFDPTETPLREVALNWMEMTGFFNKKLYGLKKNCVYFEKTREEKLSRISSLDLDIFIDDLEEIFANIDFPNIKKILFTEDFKEGSNAIVFNNWTSISNKILGPITLEDSKELAQTILHENVKKVKKIKGRGNSRIYKIFTTSSKVYILKNYPDLIIDKRKRLKTEVQSCNLLEHLNLTPKVVSYDIDLNIALFESVEGKDLKIIKKEHIGQALNLVKKIKGLENSVFEKPASEACTSLDQLFSQIELRLQKLKRIEEINLQKFINKSFSPLYRDVKEWSTMNWPYRNLKDTLPKTKQTLSFSDFGFHNSILRNDGSLCFLDLEYFGWDDPVKLIADFIWHPAMTLSKYHKKIWLKESFKIFDEDKLLRERFHASWPLYGLRWAMIILNLFNKDEWAKKIHVDENNQFNRKKKMFDQIKKAYAVCNHIKFHQMECPYE